MCCYLAADEGAESAVEQVQQQLQLDDLQPSQVIELERPAVSKPKVLAGTAVSDKGPAAATGIPCSAAVLGAAAAGLAAAVAVGVAYLNLGQ